MDLQKINEEYIELKDKLAYTKRELSKWNLDVKRLQNEKDIAKGEAAFFNMNNELEKEKEARQRVQEKKKEIIELKRNSIEKAEKLKELQKSIDDKINELRQNPEMKQHIDGFLEQVYSDKLKRLSSEKDEEMKKSDEDKKALVAKRDKIFAIQELLAKNPVIRYLLGKVVESTLKSQKIGEEFDKLPNRDSISAHEMQKAAKQNLAEFTKDLEDELKESGVNITVKDLLGSLPNIEVDKDGKLKKGLIKDSKGRVDITANINENLKGIESAIEKKDKIRDEKVEKIDKELEKYTIALNQTRPQKARTIQEPQKASTQENSNITNGINVISREEKEEIKKRKAEEKEYIEKQKEERGIKPYNILKRIAFWRERRKQGALMPPAVTKEETNPQVDTDTQKQQKNDFLDSLKFDIVREVVEKENLDRLRTANKQIENNQKNKGDR